MTYFGPMPDHSFLRARAQQQQTEQRIRSKRAMLCTLLDSALDVERLTQDLKFARARGQQVLQANIDASQSVVMVPTQATQHQRQVLQWLDGQLDDAVSRLDFAVSHPTEEAYRMWQVLYKMKTVLESASAGGRDPAIWDEDFGAATFSPDMQFLMYKFKLYLKDVASWIARTLDKKDEFESGASAAAEELQDANTAIQQKDEAITDLQADNQAMRELLAHQELLLAQFVHQGASTSGMVLMAINSGSPLDHQLKEEPAQDLVTPRSSHGPSTLAPPAPHLEAEPNYNKPLATPPEDVASAATGPNHSSNAAFTEAVVLQPVPILAVQAMQPLVQPSSGAELESAFETISRAPKSEADHADPAEHEPAKLAPQPDAKPAVQPSAVQTAEPVFALAPTVLIAPDAVMSVHVHLADCAPASPVIPSSSSVESVAPATPSWAIEAKHVPFHEFVGSPSQDSTHAVQNNGPALNHGIELAASNDTVHKAPSSCPSEAMRASKGWAMPILPSIKGSRTGAEEVWTTLQSSPRADVPAVCKATLGTSPRVDGFINKLLRRTSSDLGVISTPALQSPLKPVINLPQPKPAAHPSVEAMAAEQEWAIAVLQSMKGSHEGVNELWQALHSTPSSQVLAVCQATLGNSPGVSAFVRELWRRIGGVPGLVRNKSAKTRNKRLTRRSK